MSSVADGQQASGGVEAEVGPIEPAAHGRNETGEPEEAGATPSRVSRWLGTAPARQSARSLAWPS